MLRFIAIGLLLAIFSFPAHALQNGLLITQYPHAHWTTAQGLPGDLIRDVAQTSDGYLWFATSAGLCRFGGREMRVFNTENTPVFKTNSITAVLPDHKGRLWIGTENGLFSYDEKQFKLFSIDDGLSDNTIVSLAEDGSGKLWILTNVDLNVYDGKRFSTASIQSPISLFANRNTVLVGTKNGFASIQNGKTIAYPGIPATAIYESPKKETWIGTSSGLYNLDQGKFNAVFNGEEVRSILQDRDGNLWFGTVKGLRLLRKQSAALHPSIHAPVTVLFEDREGGVWVGTSGEGLKDFQPTPFSLISPQEGMASARTWCVLPDRAGNLWIGTEDGVSRWANQEITNYHLPVPAKSLAEDAAGTIWAGTTAGIFRWNQNSFDVAFSGIDARSLAAQKNGDLWIGSADGLRKVSNNKIEQVSTEEINTLFVDHNDHLWVGMKTGMKSWDNELQETSITDEVACIQTDREGNLWAGSPSNFYTIRRNVLKSYPILDGCKEPMPIGFVQDSTGTFWITSEAGILHGKMQKEKLYNAVLRPSQGLLSSEASKGQPSVVLSADGTRLWIATVNGVAELDTARYYEAKTAPPVVIERVLHDGVEVENFRQEKLSFSAETSRIDFQYAGITFLPGVNYRYVLQGYDKFWTNAGVQTRATYTNLAPGKYRFKVLAGRDDDWNIAGDSVSFEIEQGTFQLPRPSILLPVLTAILGFVGGWFLRQLILRVKV